MHDEDFQPGQPCALRQRQELGYDEPGHLRDHVWERRESCSVGGQFDQVCYICGRP